MTQPTLYVSQNGQETGPYTFNEVQQKLWKGELQATDHAWYEGLQSWVELGKLPGITITATPPPIPQSAPTQESQQSNGCLSVCVILFCMFAVYGAYEYFAPSISPLTKAEELLNQVEVVEIKHGWTPEFSSRSDVYPGVELTVKNASSTEIEFCSFKTTFTNHEGVIVDEKHTNTALPANSTRGRLKMRSSIGFTDSRPLFEMTDGKKTKWRYHVYMKLSLSEWKRIGEGEISTADYTVEY